MEQAVLPIGAELAVRSECKDLLRLVGVRTFVKAYKPSDHTGMWYELKNERGEDILIKNSPNEIPISQFPASWFEQAGSPENN